MLGAGLPACDARNGWFQIVVQYRWLMAEFRAGGPKEPHLPYDDKWRPPHGMSSACLVLCRPCALLQHVLTVMVCCWLAQLPTRIWLFSAAGFGPGPSMRDAPGFGHNPGFGSPGSHAFPEQRGEPTPAGTGRGFAIGRGRGAPGDNAHCLYHASCCLS